MLRVPMGDSEDSVASCLTASPPSKRVESDERWLEALVALRWHRLRFRVRNVRNRHAREAPLNVCLAIAWRACRGLAGLREKRLLFHPVSIPFPERIRKGANYHVEAIFLDSDEEEIDRWRENLRTILGSDKGNELHDCGEPEERTAEDALTEVLSRLDPDGDEICLDFLTPFAFREGRSERSDVRWRFEPAALAAKLEGRLASLVNGGPLPATEVDGLRTLSAFWDFRHWVHQPKSQTGSRAMHVMGMQGPLYLRGPWRPLLPALAVASELHLGKHVRWGQGRFVLSTRRNFFDRQIRTPATYLEVLGEEEAGSDLLEEAARSLGDPSAAARALVKDLTSGQFRPSPGRTLPIEKKVGSGTREIALLDPADMLVRKALHRLFRPVFDRLFQESSVGYRPGRSVATARKRIAAACREGRRFVFESDIASFFDEIRVDMLEEKMDDVLPRPDKLTREILSRIVRSGSRHADAPGAPGAPGEAPHARGLLQGCPLSPLLANLFVDSFDVEMRALGLFLVRYGDDFVVLTRDESEANRACAEAKRILEALGLRLKEEKTAVHEIDEGFQFLGMELDSELAEEILQATPLKKTVYVNRVFGLTGVDGDSLVIRKDKALVQRIPLSRILDIVVIGGGAVSARLLERCASSRIPISFCRPCGRYIGTFHPRSRKHHERGAAHDRAFRALPDAGRARFAADIVAAKIGNHIHWLGREGKAAERGGRVIETLARYQAEAAEASSVERLLGIEGNAARVTFGAVNDRIRHDFFKSLRRVPHRQPDPLNLLLDFGYFLLFTRLNVLLRGHGLNPYLGFLHSAASSYESLVCDLQEPFRARIDRFVVKTINRRVVRAEDFECRDDERWHLSAGGSGRFAEAFSREMEIGLKSDPGTLRQLLTGQVLAIRRWADHGMPPVFFKSRR